MSLTQKLLASHKHLQHQATQHAFLRQAGNGSLASATLCAWLVQDVHYTRSYLRFIGGLLSKLDIPVAPDAFLHAASHEPFLHARIFNVLHSALGVISTEMRFFEDTARKYALPLRWDAQAVATTREYKCLFEETGVVDGAVLLDGLVLLWATEWCYFTAWSYAREQQGSNSGSKSADRAGSSAVAALHEAFIPNWTSEPFEAFVKECGDVVDALARQEGLTEQIFERCEKVFKRVLELEVGFWPEVG